MKRLISICAAAILLAAIPAMAMMTGNELKKAADDGEKHPNSYPDGVFDGMVFGKTVEVEQLDTDRYGRTVVVVRVDSKCVNEELVKAGLA